MKTEHHLAQLAKPVDRTKGSLTIYVELDLDSPNVEVAPKSSLDFGTNERKPIFGIHVL